MFTAMASSRDPNAEKGYQATQYFLEWKAQRDALQQEYDVEDQRERDDYQRAKEAVEAEYYRQRQVVAAAGPQTLQAMDSTLTDKRANKLGTLDRDFGQRRTDRQTHFQKRMGAHYERFSEVIITKLSDEVSYNAVSGVMSGWTRHNRIANVLTAAERTT